MAKDFFSIPVVLGERSFKNYIKFEVMTRQKRWKKPVSLMAGFYIAATLCFAYQEMFDFAFVLGSIFVVAAVFIPTNFFRTFSNTVKEQTEKMNLQTARRVYTIYLSQKPDGITYQYPNHKELAGTYKWKKLFGVWKTKDAIYLYITENQTLIIPNNNAIPDFEDIWNFIQKNADPSKLHEETTYFQKRKKELFQHK